MAFQYVPSLPAHLNNPWRKRIPSQPGGPGGIPQNQESPEKFNWDTHSVLRYFRRE